MTTPARTQSIDDSVPRDRNELSVGEDLDFQRRWWRFEHAVWIVFTVIVALDVAGVFGRGPVAKVHESTPDGAMNLTYEQFQRFQTPSIISIHFGPNAVRDGKLQLWVSQSVITKAGNQRIIPEPASSELKDQGLLYTWPSGQHPDSADFAVEPASPGIYHFSVRLPALGDEFTERVVVWP